MPDEEKGGQHSDKLRSGGERESADPADSKSGDPFGEDGGGGSGDSGRTAGGGGTSSRGGRGFPILPVAGGILGVGFLLAVALFGLDLWGSLFGGDQSGSRAPDPEPPLFVVPDWESVSPGLTIDSGDQSVVEYLFGKGWAEAVLAMEEELLDDLFVKAGFGRPEADVAPSIQVREDPEGNFVFPASEVEAEGSNAAADIRAWALFRANKSESWTPPCGDQEDFFAVCPGDLSDLSAPGTFIVAPFCTHGDIPQRPDGSVYRLEFVFDKDGEPANNHVAEDPFDLDFLQSGDIVGVGSLTPNLDALEANFWKAETRAVDGREFTTAPWIALEGACGFAVFPEDLVAGGDDVFFRVGVESFPAGDSFAPDDFSGQVAPGIPTDSLARFRPFEEDVKQVWTEEWAWVGTPGFGRIVMTKTLEVPIPDSRRVDESLSSISGAHDVKDAQLLLHLLHPGVTDRYGEEQCKTYLEGTAGSISDLTRNGPVTTVDFNYDRDGITDMVADALRVEVEFTARGEPQTGTMHFAEVDSELRWFTDCGEPLPE